MGFPISNGIFYNPLNPELITFAKVHMRSGKRAKTVTAETHITMHERQGASAEASQIRFILIRFLSKPAVVSIHTFHET